ncbi:MAG: metallophosphoesterase [Candidatus Daviesbacteria bacterium]|nr:metallophosphoesterase [Candidatus Daviesbacteria bacterium]
MFKRHYKKRSSNVILVFFRLVLSLVMFTVLLLGTYTAYKHFSGLDPLKIDPQAIFNNVVVSRTPKQISAALSKLNLSQKVLVNQSSVPAETSKPLNSNLAFRFLIVADSHNDNADLGKAIKQGRHKYPDLKFIIGLGDYTEVGTIAELENAKKEFDNSSLRYFLIPGDHDLWDSRNRSLLPSSCFSQVFGPSYQSFELENFEFLLLDNSDNYTGFDTKQTAWIATELEKPKKIGAKGLFVFMHEPLYHPSSDHVMGWVEKSLKLQAGGLIFQLKEAGATKIFAGDIHFFSEYSEPKTNLSLVTIGAVTIERNPQAPRFAVVSVFNDGSTKVEDVIIH